jgi:hypothetical protein
MATAIGVQSRAARHDDAALASAFPHGPQGHWKLSYQSSGVIVRMTSLRSAAWPQSGRSMWSPPGRRRRDRPVGFDFVRQAVF